MNEKGSQGFRKAVSVLSEPAIEYEFPAESLQTPEKPLPAILPEAVGARNPTAKLRVCDYQYR